MAVEVIERTLAAALHRLAGRAVEKLCFIIRYKLGPSHSATVDDIEASKCSFSWCIVF